MIGIEVPYWNSACLDAQFAILMGQAVPVDSPVGEVVLRLHVQDGGDFRVPSQTVDVLGLDRTGANEELGKDLVKVHRGQPLLGFR